MATTPSDDATPSDPHSRRSRDVGPAEPIRSAASPAPVVVVGGGYAGVHAARAVTDAGLDVIVVDPAETHDFLPRLAAVAGGTAAADDAATPLDRLLAAFPGDGSATHHRGSASAVGDGWIELDDGHRLDARAVVVTAGASPVTPDIPGFRIGTDHVRTLRSARDAVELRRALPGTGRLTVVGGGPSGVQLTGSAAAAHPDLDVHLVEVEEELLPGFDPALRRGARRILTDRGIVLHLGTGLSEVRAGPTTVAVLSDGSELEGLIVWTAGVTGRAGELGIDPVQRGRILVDDHLRVMGTEATFAAGDVVLHLDEDGEELPMSAQIAVQAGRRAGANAARLVLGEALERPGLRHRGWVLDLGGRRGLAEIGPVRLDGPVLDLVPPLLHTAIDLRNLVELFGPWGWRQVLARRPGADPVAGALDALFGRQVSGAFTAGTTAS